MMCHDIPLTADGESTKACHSNPIEPPLSYGFPMVFLWFSQGSKLRDIVSESIGIPIVSYDVCAKVEPLDNSGERVMMTWRCAV